MLPHSYGYQALRTHKQVPTYTLCCTEGRSRVSVIANLVVEEYLVCRGVGRKNGLSPIQMEIVQMSSILLFWLEFQSLFTYRYIEHVQHDKLITCLFSTEGKREKRGEFEGSRNKAGALNNQLCCRDYA